MILPHHARIGTKVRASIPFNGVPAGTEGIIDENYGEGIMIRWERFPGDFLRDGFSWDELEYLELVRV